MLKRLGDVYSCNQFEKLFSSTAPWRRSDALDGTMLFDHGALGYVAAGHDVVHFGGRA